MRFIDAAECKNGNVRVVVELAPDERAALMPDPGGEWWFTIHGLEPSDGHWIVRSEPPILFRLAALPEETPPATCPKCRHAAHGPVCFNMASDNDCSCAAAADLPVQGEPQA